MAKILASRASALGGTRRTNVAFNKLFGNIKGGLRTKNILFKSFKSQANNRVVTKDTIRHTIAEATKKGLSRQNAIKISGEVLKGESSFSRLRYVNDSESIDNAGKNISTPMQQKQEVAGINRTIQKKIEKKNTNKLNISANVQEKNIQGTKVLDFGVYKKNIRSANDKNLIVQRDLNNVEKEHAVSLASYLANRKGDNYSTEEAKSMLAKIQGDSDQERPGEKEDEKFRKSV